MVEKKSHQEAAGHNSEPPQTNVVLWIMVIHFLLDQSHPLENLWFCFQEE